MAYTYKQTETGDYPLWTVGSYDSGKWEPESDHNKATEAAERVRILNGGNSLTPLQQAAPDLLEALESFVQDIDGHPSVAAREHYRLLMTKAKQAINKVKGL